MIPEEQELVRKYRGRPFALLGINVDSEKEVALKTIAQHEITWPNWWDDQKTEDRIIDDWAVRFLPTIYILDQKGVIRYKHLRGDNLTSAIDKLLAEEQ